MSSVDGPNYTALRADIKVTHGGSTEIIQPETRSFPVARTSTTEVAIRKTLTGDVYVALGDQVRDVPGSWRIRIAQHPLIDWVFGGAGLIAIGGFLSLAARLRRRSPVQAAETEATGGQAPAVPASTPA